MREVVGGEGAARERVPGRRDEHEGLLDEPLDDDTRGDGIEPAEHEVEGLQLCNQAAIYALDAEARSRIMTAYMVAYFAGGIVGSLVAGVAYQAGGWPLVCGLGAASAALGLAARSVFAGSRSGRAAA
ncbi:hypothetical protein NVS88_15805 [Corynebacteriales bacterium D3-21]|uniref:Uncharacterized protein n=1 Tax=Speluncibacter jeojiensis TaxID=2710754 RepID=A0A9X4REK4_9ACTN|nr:hypothetical protein [Corynebacteriales bacterium D3-21]